MEEEFRGLISTYTNTIRSTAGCGSRGQGYIDSAYQDILDFVKEHPEYKTKVPKKYTCQDDGAYGMKTGWGRSYY